MTFRRKHLQAYTLIEMLVVLGIIGVLLSIGVSGYWNRVNGERSASFAQSLAQDINLARSIAMAQGRPTRVTFNTASSYIVAQQAAGSTTTWNTRTQRSDSAVTLSGVNVGDQITCTSSGFCLGYDSTGALKTINSVTCVTPRRSVRLSITVLGLTRIES